MKHIMCNGYIISISNDSYSMNTYYNILYNTLLSVALILLCIVFRKQKKRVQKPLEIESKMKLIERVKHLSTRNKDVNDDKESCT